MIIDNNYETLYTWFVQDFDWAREITEKAESKIYCGARLCFIVMHLLFFMIATAIGAFVCTSDQYMLRMLQLGIFSAIYQGSLVQHKDKPAMQVVELAK